MKNDEKITLDLKDEKISLSYFLLLLKDLEAEKIVSYAMHDSDSLIREALAALIIKRFHAPEEEEEEEERALKDAFFFFKSALHEWISTAEEEEEAEELIKKKLDLAHALHDAIIAMIVEALKEKISC